jgi:hypothetical protein
MKAHYHVYAGTVGCLPDGECDTYTYKKDAESEAKEQAAIYRECGYHVSGNVKIGYNIDPINRLYVERCNNAECLEEDDWHV